MDTKDVNSQAAYRGSGLKPPNILLLFADQHHADWVGSAGRIPVRTPNLDRLAREGVRFTGCRVPSPMCAPARACLATGLLYRHVGVPTNRYDLDPDTHTFMKSLREVGYRAEVSGKTDLHKKSQLHGIDGWSQRLGRLGFTDAFDHAGKRDSPVTKGWPRPYEPYMCYMADHDLAQIIHDDYAERARFEADGNGVPVWPAPYQREHHIDDFGARAALRRLQPMPRGAPWFLQINFGSPHPPFDASPDLVDRYRDTVFPDPRHPADDPTDHQAVRRAYAASIEGVDEWIGHILAELDRRGEREHTLVCYTADHGEMLGDGGLWNKGFHQEASVRVPLVVSGPSVRPDSVCEAPVDLLDLAATFCDVADADFPADRPGRSITDLLEHPDRAVRRFTVSGYEWWDMITDGTWKYVVEHPRGERPGSERLIRIADDPDESNDLSADYPDIARELENELSKRLRK